MIRRALHSLDEAIGTLLTLVGFGVVWAIDRAYALAGKLEDGEREHWD